MPREVFAEEIETFLERLDAVAATRVVANEAGEIERIYVTTESARDDGAIRRAITSALMSQFNLPVDGWRIQIAHFELTPELENLPECRLVRLEETITETLTRAQVELRYERDGVSKTLIGAAQAPPGQAHRLRTVAAAAIEALRPLAQRSGSKPSLEGLTLMPFAGATVALAAISMASERASLLHVGAAVVSTSETEAVVGAVLDAVRKPVRPVERAGGVRPDRRYQIEGLRQHYERLIRRDGEPAGVTEPAHDHDQKLADIRPEREGGAAIVTHDEIRGDAQSAAKSAPRASVEDAFYRRLVATGAPVHIRCRDGYEIPTGVVKEFGTYSLLVEVNGVQELVFKHGIIAIRPYGPLPPESGTPS
ncbi:MAG: hypothetical protein RDU83_11210 [bacterium]|nr:hypothetical protein [bacterium]